MSNVLTKKAETRMRKLLEEVETRTFYELLGVHAAAQPDAIREARRQLALELHPDRHGNHPLANQLMGAINHACDVLCTPTEVIKYRAVLKSTMDLCENCNGQGYLRKQRGFKAVEQITCVHCRGVGFCARPVAKKQRKA